MPIFLKNEKKVFFIHIPKCGGTSIEKYLLAATGGIEFFSHDIDRALKCTPQHIDRTLIHSLFFQGSNDFQYVAVVRHPLLRIISEYFHDNRNKKKPPDFGWWLKKNIKNVKRDLYLRDNHLRNQVDFLVEDAAVFHFENGLIRPIEFSLNALGIYDSIDSIPHEKKYKKFNISISQKSIKLINSFYKKDFDFFGYEAISCNEELEFDDVKKLNLRSSLKDGYKVLQRCKSLEPKFNSEFKYAPEPFLSNIQKIKRNLKKIYIVILRSFYSKA